MIELKNVNKYFNRHKKNEIHVINDTTLTLPDSGLVALLGESGCGKTTMLNAIGGLDKVGSGSIFINGKKITGKTSYTVDKIRNLSVGYIFQDYKLMDDMTVYDNVALALKMVGIKDKKEIKERVEYVLEKTGILRYRYRPASTLSGGERQRVGIARALVKNPDIILADEPTGNLDSKNSVEVMNIIKTISKNRLVVLVTHERKLAEFYASRIIEVVDGKVVNDYENVHDNALDYDIDNVFYLKDFEQHKVYGEGENRVDVYSAKDTPVNVNLIFKNGNIYIQSKDNLNVEVIDESSGFEVIDDHKRQTTIDSIEDYEFNMDEVGNKNIKKKYSSIMNPFSSLIYGFKKIFSFPVVKKLLLLGFVLTGVFIMFGVSRIGTVMTVEDKDFITSNRNYIVVEKPSFTTDEFELLEKTEGISYALPGNSKVNFKVKFHDYYQTSNVNSGVFGSVGSLELISEDDIIFGKMAKGKDEIVIDDFVAQTVLENENVKMAGVLSNEDLIGRKLELKNGKSFTLVGICMTESPSIFVDESQLLDCIYYSFAANTDMYYEYEYQEQGDPNQLTNYESFKDSLKLTKGNWPVNDYEIIVNDDYKDQFPLNKNIKTKVNGQELKVVGYYTSSPVSYQYYFCNENTIRIKLISTAKVLTLCATEDRAGIVSTLKTNGYQAYDSYEKAKQVYNEERKDTVKSTILLSGIIMVISLVEMYLISRSSFLSRIKEVGTLRAIGAKKTDIYHMFTGEIFAITTLTSLPAILAMYYLINVLATEVPYFSLVLQVKPYMLLIALGIVYVFNLIFGLLPVANTIRKKPAAILARNDVD
ncbi:MAG: ATP-binding cassette domain-containing protein [Oscillospiraceae bacterium]|nr:ATP-binding cassette domain-containing protein [Oscillospiraceae bacterium]